MTKKAGKIFRSVCTLLGGIVLGSTLFACTPEKEQSSGEADPFENFQMSAEDSVWTLQSKDAKMTVNVYYYRGSIAYEVSYDNKVVVGKSLLGIKADSVDLTNGLTYVSKSQKSDIEISYDTITGKKSHVETTYNELTVSLSKDGFDFDVIMRAYNDGFAFRYEIDNDGETAFLSGEQSQFAVPEKSVAYVQQPNYNRDFFSYEESYEVMEIEDMATVQSAMPVLYQTQDNVWALLTEADLYGHDYIGSMLECNSKGVLKTIPGYGSETMVEVSLPFESPWRLGVVGSLATVTESTLVEDVYGDVEYWKPDDYAELSPEEQEIYNYDWVTPGAAAWDWLYNQNSQGDYYMHLDYLQFAIDNNLKWIILDGGWGPGNPDAISLFKELITTAHANDIKVMVWGWAHEHMGDEAVMIETLDRWQSYGIDGLKIDYFDGNNQNTPDRVDSQNTLKITERLYQECAKRKLVLNCHGCNKPTGERRLYPHVINREAIRGNENIDYTIQDMVALPFIRGSIGPSDYTPTLVPMNARSTVGSQLAMHILLETGSVSLADTLAVYGKSIATQFIVELPTRYDDMKLLGGNPSKYCLMMRNAGETYYVAGITINPRDFTVDCSFLGEGTYKAEIYYDVETANKTEDENWSGIVPLSTSLVGAAEEEIIFERRTEMVTKTSKLTIPAIYGGGFALKIVKL